MEVVRLSAKDYEDGIDFLNLIFGRSSNVHHFEEMLPIIYRPTEEHMNCNFAVKENGKIRGIVGLFPAEMKVGDTVLKVGGIGGVSAHPNDKGKGWMKLLMNRAIEEMKETDVDLSWLGGLRQRYQYFGYEKFGVMLDCKVSKTNMRHVFGEEPIGVRLAQLESSDMIHIEKAKKLHDSQPVYCERNIEDFWLFLTAVFTTPWIAFNEDGEMAGYLVYSSSNGCINEIFAENDEILIQMLRAWLAQEEGRYVHVKLAPWQKSAVCRLGMIAEDISVEDSGNFQIFHWEKVVESLMKVKSQIEPVAEGSLRIGIKDYGTLEITVKNEEISCVKIDQKADIELDTFMAGRVLFGHIPVKYITNIVLPENKMALIENWFPLPLCWLIQNHV